MLQTRIVASTHIRHTAIGFKFHRLPSAIPPHQTFYFACTSSSEKALYINGEASCECVFYVNAHIVTLEMVRLRRSCAMHQPAGDTRSRPGPTAY